MIACPSTTEPCEGLLPVDPAFNAAVHCIAAHIFPLGFDVRKAAPNTFDELHSQMDVMGRMSIWSGDYTRSAFADTETWWQFRAWHDWVHYRYGAGFNMPGEHVACHIQAGQLMRLYGRTDDVVRMIAVLFCNVIGPLESAMAHRPVTDAHAYTVDNVGSWMPYAAKVVAEQGYTDADAVEYAKQAYLLRDTVGPRVPWQARPAEVALCLPALEEVA
jgi:hypothetical protein